MAAPKDFSEDGASGGNSQNSASDQAPGGSIPASWMTGGALNGMGGIWDKGPAVNASASQLPSGWSDTLLAFEDGGEVPDGDGDDTPDIADPNDQSPSPAAPQGGQTNPTSGVSDQLGDRIALALSTVDSALSYGRKLNGLPGDSGSDEGAGPQAQNMPMVPGTQSESGQRQQPEPGPLPPTSTPFGQRTVRPPLKMSANMPAQPAGQSESGIPPQQPGPGTLPPTSNPFGKRTVRPPLQMSEATPQIPEDDDEEAS